MFQIIYCNIETRLGDLTNGQSVYTNGPHQNGHYNGVDGTDEKCAECAPQNGGDGHLPYHTPYDESMQLSTNLLDAKRTERNKFFGSLPNHLDSDDTCDGTRKLSTLILIGLYYFGYYI